jgi:hypothetical protein
MKTQPYSELAQTLREIIRRYDEKRAQWFTSFGTYDGFDAWFTSQVCNRNTHQLTK